MTKVIVSLSHRESVLLESLAVKGGTSVRDAIRVALWKYAEHMDLHPKVEDFRLRETKKRGEVARAS